MRITHTWDDQSATVRIEGLARAVRVLHVTDSHLTLIDERDADHVEACEPFHERFAGRRTDASGNPISTDRTFHETMAAAADMQLDLIALTGDLIHFPSQANIESAQAALDVTALA